MAQCISQIRVKQKNGSFADVPCSRCGFCLQNKRKQWSFRLQKEARYHESAFFTTFTYSDENLVYGTDDSGNTYPILDKHHFRLFMKRLRKAQARVSSKKIKYYAVGEYGTRTNRPHYHALLFSLEKELVSKLDKIWGQGFSSVGPVNVDTIDYITKYCVTKYDQKHYLVPPFSSISNGIGLQHFKDNEDRYKMETVVTNNRGYKQKLPRYYLDKLKRNRVIQDMINHNVVTKFEEKFNDRVRKLSKSHKDPLIYLDEEKLHNNNRILKSVKKGGTF